jgi:hypothetical protein
MSIAISLIYNLLGFCSYKDLKATSSSSSLLFNILLPSITDRGKNIAGGKGRGIQISL